MAIRKFGVVIANHKVEFLEYNLVVKMVSIIIPIYNAERYVTETINSVLNQSFTDWELILVDDGSTDESLKIITKIAETDERIKVIQQKNQGVSKARNTGIDASNGEIISFLDADDCWETHNLQERITILKKPTIDWIYGSIKLVDENSILTNEIIHGKDTNILESLLSWDGNVITTPSTITLRKSCCDQIKFDTKLSTAADQDFAINLAANYNGYYLRTPLVKYRVLKNSMSRNIELMEKDHQNVFKKAARNKLFKNSWFKHKCFSNLYWILAGSWWKNGQNKLRGGRFILLAILYNPFSIIRLLKSNT